MISSRDAAILSVCLLLVSCGRRSAVDTRWHDETGYRWRALDVPSRPRGPGFTPVRSGTSGIVHRNDVADEHALANRQLLIGAGVAAGDIDGDGLPDLFFASVERPAALYHNDGNFRFTDITAASGITHEAGSTGVVMADVNGDGNRDLIVGTLGGALTLWIGDGKGHFADSTATSGFPGGFAVTTMTLADADGDGDLDLYVGTYKTRNALDAYPPQQRAFDQTVRKVGDRYVVLPQWEKEYRVESQPELGGVVRSQRAEPDLFLENDGAGHFTRVSMAGARFLDAAGQPLRTEPDYFTLASRFYDVNGDGAPDLYACNDFEDPDQFWINDGKGNFRLVPPLAMRETSNTCMAVDFGDVDRDGHVDVFTADMMGPTLADRQTQFPTHTMLPKAPGLPHDQQQWMRNMLQLARGDGTWASIEDFAGVAATDWTWGSAFVDVDLDGYEDLIALNGHRWDVRNADTFERIRNMFPRVAWNREQGEFPRSATRSFVFRNNHDLTFSDRSRAWGIGADEAISQGLALADLDGDGDLDVVATRLDAEPVLFRNDASVGRIAIRLLGPRGNADGIGARVAVIAPGLPRQEREMTAGGYYLSGSDAELAFAASRDSDAVIEVRWRDGRVSRVDHARANRLYVIDAAGGATRDSAATTTPALFENATAQLGGHVHVDPAFDDYARQPLLPNKLSQLGPGVTWLDANGDGRADLVVGTGTSGRPALLLNGGPGRSFTRRAPPGAASPRDLTSLVPVPDGKGGTTLVAGQSSYESGSIGEALALPSLVSFPLRAGSLEHSRDVMGGDSASVGPIAVADVNGDGRLDLFVGARVLPGAWPLPARSRLYLGAASGVWVPDSLNARALASLGLVSAALFTDLDGDGRPELVTTAEWGPIRVFHNESGVLRDVTRDWGLSGITSRWNGLSAGDFDGDGRMDLVATSWGRNIPWKASADRPYVLVAGNFGGQGLGLVFARRDSASGKEMPQQSFERIALAVPAARDRIATFSAYSKATVAEVLGDRGGSAVRIGATTFDHLVLLNRGGTFEVSALPGAAQLAPAFAPVVADFDGDGREDLFLAQNFSPTDIETPRFDAGAGLLLLGDGRGGFRPQSIAQSGIRVLGDQRGAAAADYDGDGRMDLAVSQNGAATTLWHNRGARQGLRVRLDGGPLNPNGVGAQLRLGAGPTREIREGSAYWSVDDPVTVLAVPPNGGELVVRWPGGFAQRVAIAAGQRDVVVRTLNGGNREGGSGNRERSN